MLDLLSLAKLIKNLPDSSSKIYFENSAIDKVTTTEFNKILKKKSNPNLFNSN